MKEVLAINVIKKDFIDRVCLNEEELKILDMYINGDSYVKIGMKVNMSERNVGRIISNIKEKYNHYKEMEIAKLNLLNK